MLPTLVLLTACVWAWCFGSRWLLLLRCTRISVIRVLIYTHRAETGGGCTEDLLVLKPLPSAQPFSPLLNPSEACFIPFLPEIRIYLIQQSIYSSVQCFCSGKARKQSLPSWTFPEPFKVKTLMFYLQPGSAGELRIQWPHVANSAHNCIMASPLPLATGTTAQILPAIFISRFYL